MIKNLNSLDQAVGPDGMTVSDLLSQDQKGSKKTEEGTNLSTNLDEEYGRQAQYTLHSLILHSVIKNLFTTN